MRQFSGGRGPTVLVYLCDYLRAIPDLGLRHTCSLKIFFADAEVLLDRLVRVGRRLLQQHGGEIVGRVQSAGEVDCALPG